MLTVDPVELLFEMEVHVEIRVSDAVKTPYPTLDDRVLALGFDEIEPHGSSGRVRFGVTRTKASNPLAASSSTWKI